MRQLAIIIFVLTTIGCKSNSQVEDITELLKSNKPEDLINGFYLIGEARDTSFLREIISNPYDPRVTNVLKFKGMSVYQSKMNALRKISNTNPPFKITYKPDSTIVNFYCKWVEMHSGIRCR